MSDPLPQLLERVPQSFPSFGVKYEGLLRPGTERRDIHYGAVTRVALRKDDLVTLTNDAGGSPLWLFALDDIGARMTADLLGLHAAPSTPIVRARFDDRLFRQVLRPRGLEDAALTGVGVFDSESAAGETFIFKARAAATLFVILPLAAGQIEAGGGGEATLHIKRADRGNWTLPDPLGAVKDEFRVDRATARAYEVKAGECIQIIDVEGQQCSDFMAMRRDALDDGLERYIDSTVTRSLTHGAYPRPGLFDKFFDQDMTPLLSVEQDTVGRHDTFALACTARGYEDRGFPGHVN
ncbi:MAG: urea carboxylase-associated family protein, partial [Pseudomonadota bacterium]